jgi:ankyrin repeat protein
VLLVSTGCSIGGGGGTKPAHRGEPPPEQVAFIEAARNGNLADVEAALKAHPEWVNVQRKHGTTALYWAAGNGHLEVVKLLLDHGADIEARDVDGTTPLAAAVRFGSMAAIQLLIDSGANIRTTDNAGGGLLCRLASRDWPSRGPEVAALLIAKGLDVNARDNFRRTALHDAAVAGGVEMALLLIAHGADVNAVQDYERLTPLHEAIRSNSVEIAEALIDAGADVNAKTAYGYSALKEAQESYKRTEIIALLKKHGAKE